MAGEKPDVLMVGARKPVMMKGFEGKVNLHHWLELKDKDAFVKENGGKIRAIAIAYTANKVDENFLKQFPKLEQVSSFGVGYDHIDAKWAGAHGIVVTNTPEVLNEEVADTAIGLLQRIHNEEHLLEVAMRQCAYLTGRCTMANEPISLPNERLNRFEDKLDQALELLRELQIRQNDTHAAVVELRRDQLCRARS